MRRLFVHGLITTTLVLLAALGFSPVAFGDDPSEFSARLTGEAERPNPVDTAATGRADFKVDLDLTMIEFELKIENAIDILSAAGAHIHCGGPNDTGPVVVFLAGAVPGGFDGDVEIQAAITQSNIVNTACGATIADLVQSMRDGNTYVNAHSTAHPTGEIRGQIEPD